MSVKTTETIPLRDTQIAMKDSEIQALYEWDGSEPNCPVDLVVNAGNQTLIISAQAQLPFDNPRIDPGDRRQGDYYIVLCKNPDFHGLQPVKGLSKERLAELERTRRLRSGDEPADWVKECWANKKDDKD